MKIDFDLNKNIKLLKTMWSSDLNIEIDTINDMNTIIFGLDNDTYYDYDNNKYIFSGKRVLLEPDEEYINDNEFKEYIDKYVGNSFTLQEAIEFVKEIYEQGE